MLLSVLTSVALAFAPSQTTWIGVEPNRIVVFEPRYTKPFAQHNVLDPLLPTYPTWKGRFEESNKPYRMWGAGIEFNTTSEVGGICQSYCHF